MTFESRVHEWSAVAGGVVDTVGATGSTVGATGSTVGVDLRSSTFSYTRSDTPSRSSPRVSTSPPSGLSPRESLHHIHLDVETQKIAHQKFRPWQYVRSGRTGVTLWAPLPRSPCSGPWSRVGSGPGLGPMRSLADGGDRDYRHLRSQARQRPLLREGPSCRPPPAGIGRS
jgi:hypothetical protein